MDEGRGRRGQPRFVRVRRPESGRPSREAAAQQKPGEAAPEPEPPREEPESHTRVVVPRQSRRLERDDGGTDVDIELREVRYGTTARLPYLRIVPRQRRFVRATAGHLVATPLASRPVDILGRYWADIRAVVIGSPFATSQAIHERLSKLKALAVLGSDPLSSSAYATEEMLIVLALAGSGALSGALPITGVVALLLAIVALSYRQTIRAYPSGGGAYAVAYENLGRWPGLMAAAALVVDYVLLVSVSVAAGVAAVTSAAPGLHDLRVPIGVAIVAAMTLGNLRGLRESGTLFAAPTYFFIIAMATTILVGLVKVIIGEAPGTLLQEAPPREELVATQSLTLFLVLRAFASGSAALTGVEAITNGVPNFKSPEILNARTTMTATVGVAAFLFLGIAFLSSRYGLVPVENETIVSVLGKEILGDNALYFVYQAATALVLILAANTSFNAFPLLSAILARDGFMPRQFTFKGDRLAYSNGIILLAVGACVLLVAFAGEVTRLIPLYLIGVFVPFALSQSGMVRRWWRRRETGWRASLAINGIGAAATAVVAIIVASTKFTQGAWISLLMMLVLILIFALIRRHYEAFGRLMRVDGSRRAAIAPVQGPATPAAGQEHVVVPVDALHKVSLATARFALDLSGRVTAVHITDDREEGERFRQQWEAAVPDVPLLLIESPYRAFVAPMLAYLESLERAEPGARIAVVLPRLILRHWWEGLLHNQDILRLKPQLRKRTRVQVIDFPYRLVEE